MTNKQFEEWFTQWTHLERMEITTQRFYTLPLSMKKGVYQKFFKENGIQIGIDLLDIDKAFKILMLKEMEEKGPQAAKAAEETRDRLIE